MADVDDARRLADAERAAGVTPDGCTWLDLRTIDDLDLPLVFRTLDRTSTPLGAQALWRWLVAPADREAVLDDRERRIALLAPPDRDRIRGILASPGADAPFLPRLLWEPAPAPPSLRLVFGLLGALAAALLLATIWPPVIMLAILGFAANVVIDDWANLRQAQQARGLEVLGDVLRRIERVSRIVPAGLADNVAGDLAEVRPLRRRIAFLAVKDPIGMLDFVRSGFLVRLWTIARCAHLLATHRERLRRLVLWVGELDAIAAITIVRSERSDAHRPDFAGDTLVASELVHPGVEDAIGNDLAGASLLITGSNMSGKSTFLRAVAINAILAQSIHTTFGTWRGPLVRVRSVMRIEDDTEAGQSKFAVEVAAIRDVLAAVADAPRALLVLDEPFGGTNPAIRVPIVVAVLDYLAERHIVLAATHDLDVAAQVSAQFERGYFADSEDGTFDRKLRPGVAPSTNAIALLRRAGYPAAILERVERPLTTSSPAATPSAFRG